MSKTKKDIKNLFELSPEGLFLEDSEGNVLDVNQEACEMLGYEKAELLGQDVDKIVPEGAPVYLPGEIDEATRAGKPIETVNLSKDGTKVPVELRGRILEVEGKERVLVSVRDISERKKAETELRSESSLLESLLEHSPDLIYFKDKEARFIRVSRSKAEEVGEDCREDLHGKTDIDYYPEEQAQEDFQDDMQVIQEEEPVLRREERYSQNGEVYWLEATKVPRYDDEGNVVGLLGISREITDRKKTEQALNEERDKLRNLHDAVDELQHQDTEEDILQTAVEVAENMLDFRFCDISLVEGDCLVPKASATGLGSEESVRFEIGEGLTGKTMERGETIWGENVREHPDAKPTSGDFRAFISVPIGELGVFQVISEKVGSFSEREVELAEILAGHLREEIMRVRLEEDLRQQAIRDPLTNLYNRRYFNETLQKEVQQADRYHKPLAFLMIDVNRFKEINDRYSHQTGDKVLQEVADLLEDNVRDADTVVRYGGDEFLVMMPETNGGITSTVNRLKEEMDKWNERSDLLDFPLTLAMGVSDWNPDQERDVEEALDEADRKMYEDKERRK